MNIIVADIKERKVTKEGPYQGQEYMLVEDRKGKQWFVGEADIRHEIMSNGTNAEYAITHESTSKGDRIIAVKFIKVHGASNGAYNEKDKDARIRESVAIKEVGDNIRAGIKQEASVMKAYTDWIKQNLGIGNEPSVD